jgi:hypothetical protein
MGIMNRWEPNILRVAEVKHLSEFRIGASIVMVSITPKLAVPR